MNSLAHPCTSSASASSRRTQATRGSPACGSSAPTSRSLPRVTLRPQKSVVIPAAAAVEAGFPIPPPVSQPGPLEAKHDPIPEAIEVLGPSNFESYIKHDGVTVVMFSGDYCGPCKKMFPEFVKMLPVFPSFKFGYFNISSSQEHKDMATRFRVRSIPSFRVYRGGRGVEETTGAQPVKLRQMLLHNFRPF